MQNKTWLTVVVGLILIGGIQVDAQQYESLDGFVIYDYDPDTRLGDEVFGTVVADFEKDQPGRNSHGGPVALQYPNGDLVAFHTNASGHNVQGWSEYAVSKDGGKTWDMYNKFEYSYEAYQQDGPNTTAWVESGLVTEDGTIVLFVTHFANNRRVGSGVMRSKDNGRTWTDYEPIDGDFVAYPADAAVVGGINYVLYNQLDDPGPHLLYVSTDDGKTWQKRSTLPLEDSKWYGTLCIMQDGRLLAGSYDSRDEHHLFYCVSEDGGHTWSEQKSTYLDKKIRKPMIEQLNGRYFLHGRSGHSGSGSRRFVLYQSEDGENWGEGTIVSSRVMGWDGYSYNAVVRKPGSNVDELMVIYSIAYQGSLTNTYAFFIKPDMEPRVLMAIDNVCAWPNLVLLPDGSIVATIFNNPSHATSPGDIDTYVSGDGGETWSYLSTPGPRRPNELRNHQAVGLANNGDLITLTTGWTNEYPEGQSGRPYRAGILDPWVSRSADGGKTWTIDRSKESVAAATHGGSRVVFGNIMPGQDGHLRAAIYTSGVWSGDGTGGDRSYVYRSTDDGRTWGEPSLLDEALGLNETAILHLGDGQWLAAARRGVGGGGLQMYRSTDDAKTWQNEGQLTGRQTHPGHLLLLDDGRVLIVYGNRNVNPRQVEARISDDKGKTWSEPVVLTTWQGDGGYPATVQREDGKLVTAFYAGQSPVHHRYHMGVIIWPLKQKFEDALSVEHAGAAAE